MSQIRVLPQSLVNKIAAGEVIERPASVVKELVENSLDGGASRIDIAIEAGGRSLIRVADDGTGMGPDDLALSVAPHATSKLAGEDDLFALHTMGFRGEALASIAAVSQMRIVTRPAGSDAGLALAVNGGQAEPIAPSPADRGTVVEVRNLFFNTPGRRKFLKADSTEFAHVTEALARIALAQTDVSFRLTHNGKTVYDLPATERLAQRIADFFGAELADGLMAVDRPPADGQSPGIRGLIGHPQHSRPSNRWQYVFLNGRYIRDRFIQHAMREAYRGLMEPSRQPVVFLFLLLPPELVDFNVHPTKIEVRFADSNRVHSAVLRCLRDKLTRTDLTATGRGPHGPGAAAGDAPPADNSDDPTRAQRIREAMAAFFKRSAPPQPHFEFQTDGPKRDVNSDTPSAHLQDACSAPVAPDAGARFASSQSQDQHDTPTLAVQIHNTYLVAQTDDGLIIVDQHALHERIIYEDLFARVRQAGDGGPALEAQRLLIPPTVRLPAPAVEVLIEQHDMLARLGLELTSFGPGEVAVCAFPALLGKTDPGQFVRDLADRLAETPSAEPELLVHEVLDMMACKAAVKAGDPLTGPEIEALLANRNLVERATSCPHGRPTMLKFTLAELEKQFKRR